MGSTHRQADKISYANSKYGLKKPNVKPITYLKTPNKKRYHKE
jgi:hypothetical protein